MTPPYNTGKDFVYKDNFKEGKNEYYEKTGITKDGIKMDTNSDDNGRHHFNWLSMMYPRLFLTKQLLKDDGVIFISIDDNEQYHLRMLMNDIFGEENFVETLVWKKKGGTSNTETTIGDIVENVVVYTKRLSMINTNKRIIESKNYSHQDDGGFYFLQSLLKTDSGMYKRETMKYGVENPTTNKLVYPPKGKRWTVGEKTMHELKENN